jgi:exodeoxyribonuclease V alpha subunit
MTSDPTAAPVQQGIAGIPLRDRGLFSSLDLQFASRLAALYGEERREVLWAIALACHQEAEGHVCADLPQLADSGVLVEAAGDAIVVSALPDSVDLNEWRAMLRSSSMVGGDLEVRAGEDPEPLILDEKGRLYLRRSFSEEARLAQLIDERGRASDLVVDWRVADDGVERLAPPPTSNAEGSDAARTALRTGLARPLTIVTGGPGTGKTTCVARLIALLIEQAIAGGDRPPRVRLLAPTGKAAAAMSASLERQRALLDIAEDVREALPTGAETLQRALLRSARRDAFGRVASRPIEADVVVIDEASMVDLAQMRELFSICRGVERLVLLGDPNQLASIDSGATLSELCATVGEGDGAIPDFEERSREGASTSPRLADSIVVLRESHRFSASSAIGRLAEAIRMGDADLAIALLEDPDHPEVERSEPDSVARVRAKLTQAVREMQAAITTSTSPAEKLATLSSRRVLCAHRRGPLGVEGLCDVLDEASASYRKTSSRAGWWRGKLLLITRNAPEQDLWNGDVGLVEETGAGLRAIFPGASGAVRMLSPGRLPAYESAIAMSVHKSQGSEYDVVDLVLGPQSSRLMTRELLYTGVTRARKTLCIHASELAIRDAIARRIARDSGLSDRLVELEA